MISQIRMSSPKDVVQVELLDRLHAYIVEADDLGGIGRRAFLAAGIVERKFPIKRSAIGNRTAMAKGISADPFMVDNWAGISHEPRSKYLTKPQHHELPKYGFEPAARV